MNFKQIKILLRRQTWIKLKYCKNEENILKLTQNRKTLKRTLKQRNLALKVWQCHPTKMCRKEEEEEESLWIVLTDENWKIVLKIMHVFIHPHYSSLAWINSKLAFPSHPSWKLGVLLVALEILVHVSWTNPCMVSLIFFVLNLFIGPSWTCNEYLLACLPWFSSVW